MKLTVQVPQASYPIVIEEGCADHLNTLVDTNRKTMLVVDSGIPAKWVSLIRNQLSDAALFCFEQGEASKTMTTLEKLLEAMCKASLNRKSQVIALGGGVCGDMAGLAAALYMRGIDFINIPTTVLSQVDSSVGGKTAVDLGSVKNIVGAFWQPKAVFIDPQFLGTLDERQKAAGLAEALKMGLLFDEDLVEEFEKPQPDLLKIIGRSIELKAVVVAQDEKESGLRKSLNFGHTIGHAIEGSFDGYEYLHGECVAAGMLYFLEDDALKERVRRIETRLNLPEITEFDRKAVSSLLRHDKKSNTVGIDCVFVPKAGSFEFRTLHPEEVDALLEQEVYA